MPDNPRLEAALFYARRGWPVFPVHYPVKTNTGFRCSCGKSDCNSAKHPMTLHGLKDASTDQSQIKTWWGKYPEANIGLATGEVSGLVVIDVDPRHGGHDSLKAIKRLGNIPITPTVFTGGGGEHIYLAHPGNGTRIKSIAQLGGYDGIDLKADGGYIIAPPSRHVSGGRYAWKVNHLKNKVAVIPDWLRTLLLHSCAPPKGHVHKDNISFPLEGGVTRYAPDIFTFQNGRRDIDLFSLAVVLRRGGLDEAQATKIVESFAKNECVPPETEEKVAQKIKSAYSRESSIGAEVREWIQCQSGNISYAECDKELHIVSTSNKALRRVTFQRAVEAGIIERVSNLVGIFRVIENNLEEIDFMNIEDESPLPIKWPFGLENLVDIMPKNIVILAGGKDAGKTVFCLNTILNNQHNFRDRKSVV
jgi:hypothetical protein